MLAWPGRRVFHRHVTVCRIRTYNRTLPEAKLEPCGGPPPMTPFDIRPHACAFFSSAEEQDRVLAEFVGEGIQRGHQVIHTVAPASCSVHEARLVAAGIDVPPA